MNDCAESSVQVFVNDDFAEPVVAGFYLPDIADGATLSAFNFNAAFGQPAEARLFSPTGRWYGAYCDGVLNFVPEGGPAVTIPGLIQSVTDRLNPTNPGLEVTPDHGKHVVQMLSWLAVDPVYWNAEREATARSGRVRVTAWLDPIRTEWDLGNGETETCANPGVVWRKGMDDSTSTCGHVYTQPSINPPDNTYDLTGTVVFEVGHSTNAPGTYGPFTPVERSTTETVQVVEIQAVAR